MFSLPIGTYNIISGWGDIPGASVYTVKENISIVADMNIALDERDAKIIDFDCNKVGQMMSKKCDRVYYDGAYTGVGFGSSRNYPDEIKTYIMPTSSFKSIFVYTYYPEAYCNESDRGLINTPEWHKLLYNLSSVTEDVTFVADYDDLVKKTTDYKVAVEPEVASWWYHARHPDMSFSIATIHRMNAPQSRVEWLSPEPISYLGGCEQYTEWWNETSSEWSYYVSDQKYPTGAETYFAFGEHPLKSGAEIHVGNGYLDIYGYISEDTFGNRFKNYSCDVSGNLTVIEDGETIIDREGIRDYFGECVYFDGTPRFDVIIRGNSSPDLSTYTKTELGFIADPTGDYQPPEITISVVGSDLYNCVTSGNMKLNLTVNDETSIASVNLKYSINDGGTWNEASLLQINGNKWMTNLVDLNDSYVSIMANATDSIGNSISRTVIKGFYVSSTTASHNDNIVTIANVTLQPGATTDVPIRLLNSTGSGGVVTLTFDPSIVDVTSAVAGDFDSIFTPDYADVSSGILRITCAKLGTDLTGDLTIATVTLEAVGTSGSCELGLSAELTDNSGGSVPSSAANGTLTIRDRVPGDVTDDGVVNIGDAVLLFNWVSFPNERSLHSLLFFVISSTVASTRTGGDETTPFRKVYIEWHLIMIIMMR
jgi:hypothetical protein